MRSLPQLLALTLTLVFIGQSPASPETTPLVVKVAPTAGNPEAPRMGDRLTFHSIIRNTGPAPAVGVVGWITLIRVDPGQEQPIDLEDWSAHKAVTVVELPPGAAIETDWPMRLIQPGQYRVAVAAVARGAADPAVSPFVDFAVREKPVVESRRVLPVALGVPMLLAGAIAWQLLRRRRASIE